MTLSLNARVLLAASAVLASFFGLAGLTLDRAYRLSAEVALHERLQGQVYALIAAADIDDDGRVYLTDRLPEARFSMMGFDLYAQVVVNDNQLVWSSPSLETLEINFITRLSRNENYFGETRLTNGKIFKTFSIGVAWDDGHDNLIYTFSAAENLEVITKQINLFRRSLWGWLGGVALLLLAVQGTIVSWGLSPLAKATEELDAIKAGNKDQLTYRYPGELQGLTNNVNALLIHQHEHMERYRRTLGDLAHSLKTPLSVLQVAADENQNATKLRQVVEEQLERMNQITEYQLQRAAAVGQVPLVAPVSIFEITKKVLASLDKVYADKKVVCHLNMREDIVYHGDEGDLIEIIGNLADNAYKWCKRKVEIQASVGKHPGQVRERLKYSVHDDGPGISSKLARQVIQRGVRADEGISGHGIGLSVVQDIVQIYGGKISIAASDLGGAEVTFTLPEG